MPSDFDVEYIFIVGPQGEQQTREFMEEHHPDKKVHFVLQAEMRGQSDAVYLAREYYDRADADGFFGYAGGNRLFLPERGNARMGLPG